MLSQPGKRGRAVGRGGQWCAEADQNNVQDAEKGAHGDLLQMQSQLIACSSTVNTKCFEAGPLKIFPDGIGLGIAAAFLVVETRGEDDMLVHARR